MVDMPSVSPSGIVRLARFASSSKFIESTPRNMTACGRSQRTIILGTLSVRDLHKSLLCGAGLEGKSNAGKKS